MYLGCCSNPENFVTDSFENIEYDFDEFVGLKKGLRNSPAIWKFVRKTSMSLSILLCSTVQFAQKKDKFDFFKDEKHFKNVLGCDFFDKLNQKRNSLYLELNLSTFE